MKTIEKYKQYGFLNFIIRFFLSVLSKFGIKIDRWLICTQVISLELLSRIELDENFQLKELSFEDFKNSGKFDKNKLFRIKKRFNKISYLAYGVFSNEDLAYYCWISLKDFEFSSDLYSMKLKPSEGLLFDAFCFPEYRGNKLHNYMNVFRLIKLIEYNKKEAVVVLLSENIPARKSQKKAGFSCSKMITTYSVFGKKGYFINKKINL